MSDDELDIPKGSLLKQLTNEDLTVHSVEALETRIMILNLEVERSALEIKNKKGALTDANSIFN